MSNSKKAMPKPFVPLSQRILFAISLLLILFIPLYPKIPLADVLPGYIVRLRLEDVLILGSGLYYGLLWMRRRVNPRRNPLWLPVVVYLAIGLISGVSAIFITHTIPWQTIHIAKFALHWVRRIEYMFLLFLLFDSIQTKKQLRLAVLAIVGVVIVATIYGFGQKYYQWPVYSTMNREFAKGWRLVLTEHARVPSTFAGHYDLGAYLVFVLPMALAVALLTKEKMWAIYGWVGFGFGYTLLILTASRASFIAYIISVLLLFGLLFKLKPRRFIATRLLGVGIFSAVMFMSFGDLSGRFAQIISLSRVQGYIENRVFHLDQAKPKDYLIISDELAIVADKTDVPPVRYKPSGAGAAGEPEPDASAPPPDVYEEVPDWFATISATGKKEIMTRPRQYSDAAFTYGLSSAIRFDALWPRAIAGFKRNPLLGSGYSTLTKVQVTDFSEAESTDNDYLRTLGETGILGFGAFFGTIAYFLATLWMRQAKTHSPWQRGLFFAIISGTLGLLINATYIDVFEASKVAFTFWAVAGMALAAASGKSLDQ